MSKPRQNISVPVRLILNPHLSPTAEHVYAVLKTLPEDERSEINSAGKSAALSRNFSVTVSHGGIAEQSRLSVHTVVKCLNLLEESGLDHPPEKSRFRQHIFFYNSVKIR